MKIQKHNLVFQYRSKSVPYSIYTNGKWDSITRILLMGTLQAASSAKTVIRNMPLGTAVIQGAPHWVAKADGSDITEFVFGYTAHAIDSVLRRNGRAPLHLIADSQAAPGAIYYAMSHLNQLTRLTLIQPLGLNAHVFTGDAKNRTRILNTRGNATIRQQLSHIPTETAIIRNHLRVVWYLARNTHNGVAEAQYGAGLARSTISDLKQIAGKLPIRIIVGEYDKIFPPAELAQSLSENDINDIEFIIAKGLPHSLLASRVGKRLLTLLDD